MVSITLADMEENGKEPDVCVCIYIYIYTHTHTYTCVYVYIYIYIYMYIYIYDTSYYYYHCSITLADMEENGKEPKAGNKTFEQKTIARRSLN